MHNLGPVSVRWDDQQTAAIDEFERIAGTASGNYLSEVRAALATANEGTIGWRLWTIAQHTLAVRFQRFRMFQLERGIRYETASFETYNATTDLQRRVLSQCKQFADDCVYHTTEGEGLVLFGPCGTGKDHLLTATIREGFRNGLRIEWVNGLDLYAAARGAIGDDSTRFARRVEEWKRASVFAISDPLPPTGKLSDYQQTTLLRIIDYRNARRLPVWCTINVATRDELNERISVPIADRLVDNTLCLFCNWPSYRKPVSKE